MAPTVKAIDGRSVHQIQSGQVIVDLCSVVKELVENSLDANATTIDVRFKNNGLDSIEVQDNGAGIASDDFETIALKHYTSKLSTYDDLSDLHTFGFRGEALSSLCALSKFHIVTAQACDGPKGTKLEFEISGKLKGTSVVASKQGTTVSVEHLFQNLPVRRKELEKNIKREYTKVLNLLHAYACISVGTKFSVSNVMPKGKKTIAFATNANPNTKENIANVYGAKTLLALIPLDLKFEMDPSNRPGATQGARNWNTQGDSTKEVKIVGHISRPVVGEGRQTPDRQMFFVNSRPCGLPQVAKAFNEVYKSYNITQSPFIFADIKLDTNAYDVNVSPDKRTILLHDQVTLLESLKAALVDLFEAHDQSVPQAQPSIRKPSSFKPPILSRESAGSSLEERDTPIRPAVPPHRQSLAVEEVTETSLLDEAPAHPGFVKASLIERFAGRDSRMRVVHPPNRTRQTISSEDLVEPSEAAAGERETQVAEEIPMINNVAQRESVDEDSLFIPEGPPQAESAGLVRDINARAASEHARHMERERSPRSSGLEVDLEEEESIPAIRQTPKPRSSQNTIQNAFDRMRPMRTPVQQATITVGDSTSVTTIGTASRESKRARIHTPKYGLNGTPLHQTPKKQLFMKSLRGFAAPGTQMTEEEDESETGPDSSMPDAPAVVHSSSPDKRHVPETTLSHEPSTHDAYDDSSDQVHSVHPQPEEDPLDGDLEISAPAGNDDGSDEDFIGEAENKAREEAKIAKMIAEAEELAARPTEDNLKRAAKLLKGPRKKYTTLELNRFLETSVDTILTQAQNLRTALEEANADRSAENDLANTQLDPEERLSLTVSKADFGTMRVIGQFNLGFILAVRPPNETSPTQDLFIIDQHASDEKYNFEKFSHETVLEPQRLVHPHSLELTAVEEEIILHSEKVLSANGFLVSVDTSGNSPVGQRARLLSLPMSKEATFTPTDLEELLALLSDSPSSDSDSFPATQHIIRPSRVRKLLASRACRKSVMIGKTLKSSQMQSIVGHMGSMDKPWSCPHGRPTMRHLFGIERWEGWVEGSGISGLGEVETETDWKGFLQKKKRI